MSAPGIDPGTGVSPGPHRILVAEDGPPLRKALARMLESAGWDVESFGNGEAAMERLLDDGRPRFDVVLADVRMPGMSGLELIAALRTAIEDPPACLFMSGDPIRPPATAAEDEEWPEILTKPFTPDELIAAVDRALGRRSDHLA